MPRSPGRRWFARARARRARSYRSWCSSPASHRRPLGPSRPLPRPHLARRSPAGPGGEDLVNRLRGIALARGLRMAPGRRPGRGSRLRCHAARARGPGRGGGHVAADLRTLREAGGLPRLHHLRLAAQRFQRPLRGVALPPRARQGGQARPAARGGGAEPRPAARPARGGRPSSWREPHAGPGSSSARPSPCSVSGLRAHARGGGPPRPRRRAASRQRGPLEAAWARSAGSGLRGPGLHAIPARGFYDRTEALARYFRAVSWLESVPFRPSRDEELLSFLMLAHAARSPGAAPEAGTPGRAPGPGSVRRDVHDLLGEPDEPDAVAGAVVARDLCPIDVAGDYLARVRSRLAGTRPA